MTTDAQLALASLERIIHAAPALLAGGAACAALLAFLLWVSGAARYRQ